MSQSVNHSVVGGTASDDSKEHSDAVSTNRRFFHKAAIVSGIPTLLTLLVLGGLAYWGHSTGWTLPKFGDEENAAKDDWCEEHAVPDSICVECHPDKFPPPPFFEACVSHGLVNCPLCHPEVAQIQSTPVLPKYASDEALRLMDRKKNNPDCPLILRRLQLASLETVDQLGMEFDAVTERDMVEAIDVPGEVIYDPTAVVKQSSRVAGVISEVFVRLGDSLEHGAIIALIDSPDVAKAKAELADAAVQYTVTNGRYTSLKGAEDAVGRNTLLQAKSERDAALVRVSLAAQVLANLGLSPPDGLDHLEPQVILDKLRFLGMPETLIAEIKKRTNSSGLYPVKATASGRIIETHLVQGEIITASDELAIIANQHNMLVRLALPVENAKLVHLRQKIEFVPNAQQSALKGEVAWMSTIIHDKTRTLEVRAVLHDIGEQARANEFGTARIILREASDTLVVPRRSVQWDGSCNVVFVRDKNFLKNDAPKVFHVRQVVPGTQDDTYTEILAGLLPGEIVVSKGSDVLRAKLLSGNLGAG